MTKHVDDASIPADVLEHAARVAASFNACSIDKNVLQRLPDTLRRALAFEALMLAFGFPRSAVSFDEEPLAFVPTRRVLVARVTSGNRWFRDLAGETVRDVSIALADARRLMADASAEVRDAFLGSSGLFLPLTVAIILKEMRSAEMTPRDPPDVVASRLRAIFVPSSVIATVPASRPIAPRSAPKLPILPRPPLFQVELLVSRLDARGVAKSVDLPALVARHAAGDWGACAHADENEAALEGHRPVMSVFPAAGGTIQIVTTARRDRTTATAIPHVEACAELRCTYAGIGKALAPSAGRHSIGVRLDGRGDVYDEDAVIAEIARRLNAMPWLPETSAEEATWAIWRSVRGIDFRPFDRAHRRVSGPGDAWEQACDESGMSGLCAWFVWEILLPRGCHTARDQPGRTGTIQDDPSA